MSVLASLKKNTIVVADTGDIELIRQLQPQDATTNPSLILQVASNPAYTNIIAKAVADAKALGGDIDVQIKAAMDFVLVNFGIEILKVIPGYVSSEVDARLSYDTAATIARAKEIIELYANAGVSRERVLIKIASTWEGIQAAKALEEEGIHCNLTLLFSAAQAQACAEANVTLISPFVGRILDWYKAQGQVPATPEEDPGVIFVTKTWNLYKQHGFKTIVMGASFRNIDEIIQLNGCDRLTISPALLQELEQKQGEIPLLLDASKIQPVAAPAVLTQEQFTQQHDADLMAKEKLIEGITKFSADIEKLEALLKAQLTAA